MGGFVFLAVLFFTITSATGATLFPASDLNAVKRTVATIGVVRAFSNVALNRIISAHIFSP